MDYVRVVYKRRWVAIPAFLVVFTVGAINSYRTGRSTRRARRS